VSETLTGSWGGLFDYSGVIAPVAFRAQLHEAVESLAGLIEEVDDMQDGVGPILLTAVVEGERRGNHVAFRKTYDELEPACSVEYDGIVDADGTEISGEWVRLEDGLTGSFVMRREVGREEEVVRESEVEIEIGSDR
jgi:hypothetical protein